ncbi:MAG: hypothetical protein H6622_16485 [Halobacteriovoraceae bacterium]|nr:hypothetical protein [Halobacteriovoraceae bacterium]
MKRLLFLMILLNVSNSIQAAEWSNTNIQLLSGNSFTNPFTGKDNIKKETLTFEHVSGWAYGDNFFFLDVLNFDNWEGQELYFEWHPRISMGKIFNFANKDVFLQDVYLAMEINRGAVAGGAASAAYLYGIGFDFTIPGFNVFGLNAYIKDTLSIDAIAFMFTTFWATDFMLGSTRWTFSGYLEYHTEEKENVNNVKKAHIQFAPQVLLDLGHFWGVKDKILAGTEYIFWSKKYGAEVGNLENTESNFQMMLKWNL